MKKTIFERSKEVLELKALRIEAPPWMIKQKILIEFARDAALHIIASQPGVEAEAKYRCFFCSTSTQPTEKGQACPICGGRPA